MPTHPITHYSWPSGNAAKVQAALFETGLAHEVVWIDVDAGEAKAPEFRAMVPLGQVPAITDPDGPGGVPLTLCESGAILIYLAEKTGRLLPATPAGRHEALQWVMWQAAGQGPVFGRLMWLKLGGGKEIADPRVWDDSIARARVILDHLEHQLDGRAHILGDDYTVADLALWPWLRVLRNVIKAGDEVELDARANVTRWLDACIDRPASQRMSALFGNYLASRRKG